jgi:RES domain-containing protein
MQGSGRFDLPGRPVWYLSESAAHAVAESLQAFRSRPFQDAMLRRFKQPLALVEIHLPDDIAEGIVNLDDPAELLRLGLVPSALASDDRKKTQAVAARVYASGTTGLRWWSALSGDWQTVVLFLDRAPIERLEIDEPVLLTPEHPAVVSARSKLAIG